MDKFKVDSKKEGKVLSLHMSGPLSDESDLKQISLANCAEINIDLLGLGNISSKGVRAWMLWIQSIDTSKKVTLKNCPKVFINMVNLVFDMVPSRVVIESIGVPYFCTECGNAFSDMMKLGATKPDLSKIAENKPCTKCGATAELDTLPEKYFRFLEERK